MESSIKKYYVREKDGHTYWPFKSEDGETDWLCAPTLRGGGYDKGCIMNVSDLEFADEQSINELFSEIKVFLNNVQFKKEAA